MTHERILPEDDNEELLLFQLSLMSQPTTKAHEARISKGFYMWNEKKRKKTWKCGSPLKVKGVDAKHCYFAHGISVRNAIIALIREVASPQ